MSCGAIEEGRATKEQKNRLRTVPHLLLVTSSISYCSVDHSDLLLSCSCLLGTCLLCYVLCFVNVHTPFIVVSASVEDGSV